MHFSSSLLSLCFGDLKPGLSCIISTSFDNGYVFLKRQGYNSFLNVFGAVVLVILVDAHFVPQFALCGFCIMRFSLVLLLCKYSLSVFQGGHYFYCSNDHPCRHRQLQDIILGTPFS